MTAIAKERVREIFEELARGDGATFFDHVSDNVDWTVEGTHPLAGRYRTKSDFQEATFSRLGRFLPGGPQLRLEHLIVEGAQAAVELRSMATAKNGLRFDNRYCWVVRFEGETIVEVRAYLDSALVAEAIAQNPV